jgi:hypothetical protein
MRAPTTIALARSRGRENDRFYFRVGNNDHVVLNRLIAERRLQADGLVIDARRHERHKTLRRYAREANISTCLDTQAMELAMPGATSKGHLELPWSKFHRPSAEHFTARRIEQIAESIVAQVVEGDYAEVKAPAHYVADAASKWPATDVALTLELRKQLNVAGREDVRIKYPLAVHHSVFYDAEARKDLWRTLRDLPAVDSISLRVHPFGYDSGPHVMRSFIEACWDFRRDDVPLMIERAGIVGLAAYALGAVDMVESGITIGDSFDIGSLQRPASPAANRSFAPPRRVYIEVLGAAVEHDVATKLMSSSRGKLQFACKERTCCPAGFESMLGDMERHSALTRQRQYTELSRIPVSMRAEHFIHSVFSPVCDMLTRASDVHEPFKKSQRRMLSVKAVLLDLNRQRVRIQERLRAPDNDSSRPQTARIIPLPPREPRGR